MLCLSACDSVSVLWISRTISCSDPVVDYVWCLRHRHGSGMPLLLAGSRSVKNLSVVFDWNVPFPSLVGDVRRCTGLLSGLGHKVRAANGHTIHLPLCTWSTLAREFDYYVNWVVWRNFQQFIVKIRSRSEKRSNFKCHKCQRKGN